jgi:hypothetical protein
MITRNRILFIVGLWNVLLPFLGFPSSVRTVFIVASGLVAIFLAFMYSRDRHMHARPVGQPMPRVEPTRPEPAFHPEPVSRPEPVSHSESTAESFVPPAAPRSLRPEKPLEDRFTDLKSILKHTKTF